MNKRSQGLLSGSTKVPVQHLSITCFFWLCIPFNYPSPHFTGVRRLCLFLFSFFFFGGAIGVEQQLCHRKLMPVHAPSMGIACPGRRNRSQGRAEDQQGPRLKPKPRQSSVATGQIKKAPSHAVPLQELAAIIAEGRCAARELSSGEDWSYRSTR